MLPHWSYCKETNEREEIELLKLKIRWHLLAPLGEDVEAKHALARACDELEQVDLLLGVRPLPAAIGSSAKTLPLGLRLRLLHELPQREVRFLRRPPHHRAQLHALLPQLPRHPRQPGRPARS